MRTVYLSKSNMASIEVFRKLRDDLSLHFDVITHPGGNFTAKEQIRVAQGMIMVAPEESFDEYTCDLGKGQYSEIMERLKTHPGERIFITDDNEYFHPFLHVVHVNERNSRSYCTVAVESAMSFDMLFSELTQKENPSLEPSQTSLPSSLLLTYGSLHQQK